MAERFLPETFLGDIVDRLKCQVCGSPNGRVAMFADDSPDAVEMMRRKDL